MKHQNKKKKLLTHTWARCWCPMGNYNWRFHKTNWWHNYILCWWIIRQEFGVTPIKWKPFFFVRCLLWMDAAINFEKKKWKTHGRHRNDNFYWMNFSNFVQFFFFHFLFHHSLNLKRFISHRHFFYCRKTFIYWQSWTVEKWHRLNV